LATVTSQALIYDVITYSPYEGLNYTIWDKITPLRKRICETPKIQIGCYRGITRANDIAYMVIPHAHHTIYSDW